MALETNLQAMARHLVDVFETNKGEIIAEGTNLPAYSKAVYGEPRVITQWPLLSVQPQFKGRELHATRKFKIDFVIWVVVYHGQVASTLEIQEGAQSRIEAVEDFMMTDFKWNFFDTSDIEMNKVIFGYPAAVDHPIVLAPEEELWSSSRLELRATSEEYF